MRFRESFKTYRFISKNWSEEQEIHTLDDRPTWLVNPLDGTYSLLFLALTMFSGHDNFKNGNPNVAITLAFAVNSRVQVGLVLNPFTARLYSAVRGRGSFLSLLDAELSQQIRTTKVSVGSSLPRSFTLKTEMVAVSSTSSDTASVSSGSVSQKLVLSVIGGLSQNSGSVALDLCDVASAISDLKCCSDYQIWQIAAAWLIVIEARGMILNRNASEVEGTDMLREPNLGLKEFIAVRPMMEREETETFLMDYKALRK